MTNDSAQTYTTALGFGHISNILVTFHHTAPYDDEQHHVKITSKFIYYTGTDWTSSNLTL